MARIIESRRRFKSRLDAKQDVSRPIPALEGDGNGNIDVPNQPGYVYIRTGNGDLGQAFNNRAPRADNLPIDVGYDPITDPDRRIFQVLSVRSGADYAGAGGTPYANVPSHHATHEFGGGDDVFLSWRRLMGLRVGRPSGYSVTVDEGFILRAGAWLAVLAQTLDLTASKPALATQARYVLIALNAAGVATATNGALVAVGALDISDCPIPAAGEIPLAAVRMYGTQTSIGDTTSAPDIIDLRFPQAASTGSVYLADLQKGTAQYQVITSGANPFPATWSDFFIQGSATRTYTFPNVTGAVALGAGTLTNATANDATIANHLHAVTASATPGAAASLLKTAADGQLTLDSLVVGTELGGHVPANHQMQIVTTGTKTPLLIEGGSDTIEIWKDVLPSYAMAIGMSPPGGGVTNDIIFSTYVNLGAWIEHVRITNYLGNVKIGGTAIRAGADGSKHLDIFDGVPPSGALANGISLYNASGKLRVMDAAGSSIGFDGGGASCILTLPNAATSITGGGTLGLGTFTLTVPKTGTAVTGTGTAGRVAAWVTDSNTLQAAALVAPAANVLTLTATAASTLAAAISAGKTLTLTATDDYNLTIPESMIAAGRNVANTFTVNQTISNAAPSLVFTDTTGAAKSFTIAVDANVANLRESAGAAGSLLVLDLANNRVGVGLAAPSYPFEVAGHLAVTGAGKSLFFNGTPGGASEGIQYVDSGSTARYAFRIIASDIVAVSNRAANGIVRIYANTAVAGAGGETLSATFEDDQVTIAGKFGCNAASPQSAYASGGALAAYGAGANGLDTGANMSALHAMVVKIRAALVANGIMS